MTDHPHFNIDVYDCRVYVIFDDDWKAIAAKIIKERLREDENEDDLDADYDALTIRHKGKWKGDNVHDYFMLFSKDFSENQIYHECLHVLMYIMYDFDLKLSVNNQEPAAYLGEYIINETMKLTEKGKNTEEG